MRAKSGLIILLLLPLSYLIGGDYLLGGAGWNAVGHTLGLISDTPTASPHPIKTIPCDTTTSRAYTYDLVLSDGVWHMQQAQNVTPDTITVSNRANNAVAGVLAKRALSPDAPQPYQLNANGQTLAINSEHPDQVCSFTATVQGIDTYYSMNSGVTTDIPSKADATDFRVYEQEDYLPIFGYHFVLPDNQADATTLGIKLSDFIKQVEYATDVMGCRWYTFGDIMQNYVAQGKKTPTRACVMTFDDGHRNNYDLAYPVLTQYGIKASFYIILGRVGQSSRYMDWDQIDELARAGHEIGSHTISHDGAIVPGKNLAHVVSEVWTSKQLLEARGFHVQTFAYPLGLWDATTILVLKDSKYIGARDTEKRDLWRDPRPLTTSMDEDFIWHMYYHRPDRYELKLPNGDLTTLNRPETSAELQEALGYTTWWQFEEGYSVTNGTPILRQLYTPSPQTYGVIEVNKGASITNSFILSQSGRFKLDIFAATRSNDKSAFAPYGTPGDFSVYVDGMLQPQKQLDDAPCVQSLGSYFCDFLVDVTAAQGKHTLTVASNSGSVLLDKFRIFRDFPSQNTYHVRIIENVPTG